MIDLKRTIKTVKNTAMILVAFLMIPLASNSQNIYNIDVKRGEATVHTDTSGNKFVCLHIDDAILMLTDVIDYEIIIDSILPIYEQKIKQNERIILINTEKIAEYQKLSVYYEKQVSNFNRLLENSIKISEIKDDIIKENEKRIKKDRITKTLGFIGLSIGGAVVGFGIGYITVKF